MPLHLNNGKAKLRGGKAQVSCLCSGSFSTLEYRPPDCCSIQLLLLLLLRNTYTRRGVCHLRSNPPSCFFRRGPGSLIRLPVRPRASSQTAPCRDFLSSVTFSGWHGWLLLELSGHCAAGRSDSVANLCHLPFLPVLSIRRKE